MHDRINFQELIMRLERFWANRGCTIWQPYSEKVGAGTMNPATVLRVLGPESWNVAYVEPSFRPDDGRFAENPNRMQMHTQYQVVLKPDPGNPQELYLDSLEAIGIDRKRHDIRFVEDNWESPVLGAWGLGWEVWLDGMEITQFTYFQQAGGVSLDPVAVEITYGLERIAMYQQGVREVWQLQWSDDVSYGEILKAQEVDYCEYAFNAADVDRLRTMYDLFCDEARAALDRGLAVPAHDYVLRCSHTFNLLDTRGAIGVTERARFFADMRDLARQVSEAFLKQRESLGFPLRHELPPASAPSETPSVWPEGESADLLLEIGTEEVPAADVPRGIEQLRALLPERLKDRRLAFEAAEIGGTPRRLYALVRGLAGRQSDEEKWVRGPAARAAYDAGGNPTRALEGFCRSQGVDPATVERRPDEKGVEYVYAHRVDRGRKTGELLAELLPETIAALSFPKTMRWNSDGVAYARPVRWIVALYGDRVVPFTYARLSSGRTSRGLRPDRSPEIELAAAADYPERMREHGLIVDRAQRREEVRRQVEALAREAGGAVPDDPDLLDEVTDLVEAVHALRGAFDESHLALPEEVLVGVMKKHQRYFPVRNAKTGRLMPAFITVANGRKDDPETVVRGNENVVRARYADAGFFYREDTQQPLEAFLPRLDTLTFQEKLGSVLDKARRIERLVKTLAPDLGLDPEETGTALRAAHLCKADLATSMVVEMTSLQGVMGRYYAGASGEPESVGRAIEEHYRPRFPGDALPDSQAGFAVSVADRLDSLAGLFCVGVRPRATADPYGLRRDALGLLANLIGRGCRFSLRRGLEAAAGNLPFPVRPDEDKLKEAFDFILRRLEVQLREEGFRHDLVEAAVNGGCDDPCEIRRIVEGLSRMVEAEGWQNTFNAYARCKRIVRDLPERYGLNPEADPEAGTKALGEAFASARKNLDVASDKIAALKDILDDLRDPVNRFFEDVLVMAEDPGVRKIRLGLVQHIAALPDGLADLSRLEGF